MGMRSKLRRAGNRLRRLTLFADISSEGQAYVTDPFRQAPLQLDQLMHRCSTSILRAALELSTRAALNASECTACLSHRVQPAE